MHVFELVYTGWDGQPQKLVSLLMVVDHLINLPVRQFALLSASELSIRRIGSV